MYYGHSYSDHASYIHTKLYDLLSYVASTLAVNPTFDNILINRTMLHIK